MRTLRLLTVLSAFILCSSLSSCMTVKKKDNGKHKGWYKNPKNPHHPAHKSAVKAKPAKAKGKGKGK